MLDPIQKNGLKVIQLPQKPKKITVNVPKFAKVSPHNILGFKTRAASRI